MQNKINEEAAEEEKVNEEKIVIDNSCVPTTHAITLDNLLDNEDTVVIRTQSQDSNQPELRKSQQVITLERGQVQIDLSTEASVQQQASHQQGQVSESGGKSL